MDAPTTTPYYQDDSVTLHLGDALEVARELPDGSADCIVTSPPYFALRDYGVEPTEWPAMEYAPMAGAHPLEVPAMTCALGLEPTPAAFVGHLVLLFRELRRVLADYGTLWINLGDTYSSPGGHTDLGETSQLRGGRRVITAQRDAPRRARLADLPPKNLIGIPWRTAMALQDDGWILRNEIIWAKPNGMPESVTDRLSSRHEHLFMFAKSPRCWFDLDAIREQYKTTREGALTWDREEQGVPGQKPQHRPGRAWPAVSGVKQQGITSTRSGNVPDRGMGRNPGDVWEIATQPFREAHFAVMPLALAERCIQAGCKPGGVVLDPFSGSGTTGLAAARHGRRYVGTDVSREYLDLSLRTRLAEATLDFEEGTA